MLTDRETTVTDDTVPIAFSLSSSAVMKLPMRPAPITAKERKTISFVRERKGLKTGNDRLVSNPAQDLKKGSVYNCL